MGKKYKEMPEAYRERNTRQDFRTNRKIQRSKAKNAALEGETAPRMAGDKVFDLVRGESFDYTKNREARLDDKIANMRGRKKEGMEINQEKLDSRIAKREKVRDRRALQEQFDGSMESYNYGSFGGKNAGLKDVESLLSAGFTGKEIAADIEKRGLKSSGRVEALFNKYLNENMNGAPRPIQDPAPDLDELDEAYPAPGSEINVNPTPVITPGGSGGTGSPSIATGVIGGNTGDVGLTNSSNYGTINTGIINDNDVYGGGYTAGSNNTGLTQAYIDQMQENWEDYSGPGYGMYVTDRRVDAASKNNPINTDGLYGSMGNFAQNFYDRGTIASAGLYGDPYRFPQPTYGGYPTFSDDSDKK